MNAKHTQGPWKADGYHVRQSGQRGTRMITDVCYTGPHHTPPDEYPKSCRLADEANARLIAAAPDLIEAVEMWIHEKDSPAPCWAMKQEAERKMRSALSKAKGETP